MPIDRKGADVEALVATADRIEVLARTCADDQSNTHAAFGALPGS